MALLVSLCYSCKKEVLTSAIHQAEQNQLIKAISYTQFIGSVNLDNTGVLRPVLLAARNRNNTSQSIATYSPFGLQIDTSTVKKLSLGDTTSYVLALLPTTPRAINFQNLTIQIVGSKVKAFLTNYIPTKEWIAARRDNKPIQFNGKAYINKILLEGSSTTEIHNVGETKTMSSSSSKVMSIGGARVQLAPGECEIYDVIEVIPYGCSTGCYPGFCIWETGDRTEWIEGVSYLPGYTNVRTTVVNCEPFSPAFPPSGGSGGGGSTTPNPPGNYDPCDGATPSIETVTVQGVKVNVVPPPPCDENGEGPYPITPPTYDPHYQYLPNRIDNIIDVETGQSFNFGDIEDFYNNNPEVIEALLSEDPIILTPSFAMLSWLGIRVDQVAHEAVSLSAIHKDWSTSRIMAVATWNVMKGDLHFVLEGVGLIPAFGEAADIVNGAIYFLDGDYINAAFSTASAVPIWGWVSNGAKWSRTTVKILSRPISEAAGKQAFKAIKNSKGAVRFVRLAVSTFSHTAVKALKAVKPADNTLTNLSRFLLDQYSHRIKPTLTSLKTKIDDIVDHGDVLGTKTESLCDDIFETEGFVKYEAKLGSNGFDGVYIKKDATGNVQEIIINDAKQISAAGNIKLSPKNPNTSLPAQMSDDWIDNIILKLQAQGGSLEDLSIILNANKNKITKTVTAVDKATKEIVVLKLSKY